MNTLVFDLPHLHSRGTLFSDSCNSWAHASRARSVTNNRDESPRGGKVYAAPGTDFPSATAVFQPGHDLEVRRETFPMGMGADLHPLLCIPCILPDRNHLT